MSEWPVVMGGRGEGMAGEGEWILHLPSEGGTTAGLSRVVAGMVGTAAQMSVAEMRSRFEAIACRMRAGLLPAFDALTGCLWQRKAHALSVIGAAANGERAS